MKNSLIHLIALCSLAFVMSCDKTDKSIDVDKRPDKEVAITKSELHAKLDNAGAALVNSVETDDFEDIIIALNNFDELASEKNLESELEEYFDKISLLSKSAANALNSRSYSALMKAKKDFEVYTLSIRETLGSNGLLITYSANGGWTVSESKEYAITIDYGDIIRLSYSKDATEVRYDDEYYEESYIVSVPKTIDFEIIIDGKKALNLNLNAKVDKDLESAEPSVSLEVGDLVMSAYAIAKGDMAGANYTFSKGGKTIFSIKGNFKCDGITDIDKWMEDDLEEICENSKISAEFEVQVMDLSLTAVADFSKFLKQYNSFFEKEGISNDKSYCVKYAKIFNDNFKAYLVDLDAKAVVADVRMAVASEGVDGQMVYYVEPVVELADGETISIISYFEDEDFERMFDDTIYAFEEFIRTVEDLLN